MRMSTLAGRIEAYLKRLIESDREGQIEIRRCELAESFQCVPSQINYVLETRFTPEKGYIVESKRGGGGFIRITSVELRRSIDIASSLYRQIGREIDEEHADHLLSRLIYAGAIDQRKATLIRAAIRREMNAVEPAWRPYVRAMLLKAMLLVVMA